MLRLNKIVLAACVSLSALYGAAFAQDATVVANASRREIRRVDIRDVGSADTRGPREYIENGEKEGRSLLDAMRDGVLDGMQYFDGELEKLVLSARQARIKDSLAGSYGDLVHEG